MFPFSSGNRFTSSVTTVHPSSSSIKTCQVPMLIIGSIVNTIPGTRSIPVPFRPKWQTSGSSWNSNPTPRPHKSRTTEYPFFSAWRWMARADITDKTERFRRLHTDFKTLFRHPHQLFLFRGRFTYNKHTGSIRVIPVQDSRNIYIDNIPLFQYLIFTGNTVADHLVDRSADTFRKPFIIQRRRNSPVRNGIIIYQLIDLGR